MAALARLLVVVAPSMVAGPLLVVAAAAVVVAVVLALVVAPLGVAVVLVRVIVPPVVVVARRCRSRWTGACPVVVLAVVGEVLLVVVLAVVVVALLVVVLAVVAEVLLVDAVSALARGVVPGEVKGGGMGDKASAAVRSAVIGAFTFTSLRANG